MKITVDVKYNYGDHIEVTVPILGTAENKVITGRVVGFSISRVKELDTIQYAILEDYNWSHEEGGCKSDWEYFNNNGPIKLSLRWVNGDSIKLIK